MTARDRPGAEPIGARRAGVQRAPQRPGGDPGRLQPPGDGRHGGRAEVAQRAAALLVGLGAAHGEHAGSVGVGLDVGHLQGGELRDAQQRIGADADERRIAQSCQRAGGRRDGGGRLGGGPGQRGGLAAAAVAALAADAVQGVAHQRIGGGVGGVLDLVGLGDRGARHAHGGRGGAGGVAVLEVVGDVDGAGGQLAAAVVVSPLRPRFPGRGVGAAGGRRERGGAARSYQRSLLSPGRRRRDPQPGRWRARRRRRPGAGAGGAGRGCAGRCGPSPIGRLLAVVELRPFAFVPEGLVELAQGLQKCTPGPF